MRKILFLVVAVVLLATPALADSCPGNEVINGDFSTKDLSYWQQGDKAFNITANGPPATATNWWAQKTGPASMYQVFVEPDWDPRGTKKEASLSFKLGAANPPTGVGQGNINATFFYYDPTYSGDTAPVFTSGGGGDDWEWFFSGTLLGASDFVNGEPDWHQFSYTWTLSVQPKWLAVEVTSQGNLKTAVDDVCFQGKCVVTPLPSTLLFLGSGLAALSLVRRRRQS